MKIRFVGLALVIIFSGTIATSAFAASGISVGGSSRTARVQCLTFLNNIFVGQSNNDVTNLQTFLSAKGYVDSSNITGYFGSITRQAVVGFQADNDLPQTGYVGPLTRQVIHNLSCGSSQNQNNNQNQNQNQKLTITKLGTQSGPQGTDVTIYGTGFDSSNNTVMFGTVPISGVSSDDGTSVDFTVPAIGGQSCPIYSTNGCYIENPSQQSELGKYQLFVLNSKGVSNVVTFTLTSGLGQTSSSNTNRPSISRLIGPQLLKRNDIGIYTLLVTSNSQATTTYTAQVLWGDEASSTGVAAKSFSMTDQQTLTFSHTYATNGRYNIYFTVTNPDTNYSQTKRFTVTVSDTAPKPSTTFSLSSIYPSSGKIGTTVSLVGQSLPLDATVHFGVGGIKNQMIYDYGSLIIFSIPSAVNPCDIVTNVSCFASPQLVVPGRYPVYVSNSLGQITNTLSFTVTN
jgi:peptidoglycan hydrolase-like protein with peptidoglycan-binding domain